MKQVIITISVFLSVTLIVFFVTCFIMSTIDIKPEIGTVSWSFVCGIAAAMYFVLKDL